MANIVILDGYELNNDLDWRKLKNLGNCTFYNRSPINDDKEVLKRIGDAGIVITHKTPLNDHVISNLPKIKYIWIMGTGYDVVNI